MKTILTFLILVFAVLQLNAQQFIDVYIHIKPDYSGNGGELMILDCEDPNATVTKTVTFDGNPLPTMQATGITPGVKTLHFIASDGTLTYEFEANIDFNSMNPSINYTITPTIEPMSVIETIISSSSSCNGEIDLIVSGGNLPYNFSWFENSNPIPASNNQPGISGLCAGSYSYKFGDNSTFCSGSGFVFNVDILLLDCLVDVTDISCFGMCDGDAELIVLGSGTGIMTSDISNTTGDSHPMSLTNLCQGMISGMLQDRTGAMAQCQQMVNEPVLINFNLNTTDLTSPGSNDGTAEVNVTQGAGPITYDWTGPNTYSASGSNQVNALEAGAYDITMTYNNGKCDTTQAFDIYDALQIIITSVDPHTTNPPNGAVYFTISGGAEPYDTILDDGQTQMNNGPFTGLSFGEYTLIVTDSKGNSADSTFMVNTFVSVNMESLSDLTIYPNPATNILNVKGENLVSAVVYDLNGRLVITSDLMQTNSIDVSRLESGIYTVSIHTEKGEYIEKLIIQ